MIYGAAPRSEGGVASRRIPKRVGPYIVQKKIAAGGMGEVLLGLHTGLQRPTALKRLTPPSDADQTLLEELQERFEREGRVLAQFHHQAICGVYDLLQWRNTTYLALEYVDGFDLRTLLKARELPLDVALIVAIQIAEALQHAHKYGIIHRDVKPGNIMVSRSGEVKLMDFGIARGDELEVLTRTGMFVGTPTYTAPEVLGGGEAGAKADVYSLAATVYRCVAGRGMFPSGQAPEVRYRHIFDGVIEPIQDLRPEVSEELAMVVHRGLALDPSERFPSMAAFRRALEIAMLPFETQIDHPKRLVEFLYAAGLISAEEVDTTTAPQVAVAVAVLDPTLDGVPMDITDSDAVAPRRQPPWLAALGVLVGVAVAVALAALLVDGDTWLAAASWVRSLTGD